MVYAIWTNAVGELSQVLDCDNLKFEDKGATPWEVDHAHYHFGGSSLFHTAEDTDNGILSAETAASPISA